MATLQQITTKAKVLYKTGKYKKWTDAIKAASKLVKKKPVKKAVKKAAKKRKVGAIKIIEKGETKNTRPKKVYQYTRSKTGTFKGLKTISGVNAAGKKIISEKLKTALYKKETAKLKRDKNKHSKEVRELKKQLQKYL